MSSCCQDESFFGPTIAAVFALSPDTALINGSNGTKITWDLTLFFNAMCGGGGPSQQPHRKAAAGLQETSPSLPPPVPSPPLSPLPLLLEVQRCWAFAGRLQAIQATGERCMGLSFVIMPVASSCCCCGGPVLSGEGSTFET